MRIVPLPGVFQPPGDAWLLVDCLRRESLREETSLLDLCAGSGVLAIAAALEGASKVTAVDISRRAVLATRLGALANGVKVEAIRGDLFEAVGDRRFDVIVSNPPYLPGAGAGLPRRGAARAWEGGRSGRWFIDRVAADARGHLTPGGILLLVCSSVCGEEQTLSTISEGGLQPEVVARHRGPLGPRLRARSDWLRRQGLLLDGDEEEILVIRAARAAESGFPSPARRRSTSSPDPSPGRSAPARGARS